MLKVHLTAKFFFAKTIKLILWGNLAQTFFDLVKSSNFYAPSKYRYFGSLPSLTERGSRAECEVKSRTRLFCSSHILLVFVGKAEEVGRKISSQEHGKGDVATQQTYGGYYALCHIAFI